MPLQDAPRIPEMPQEAPEFDQEIGGAMVTRRGNGAVVDFAPGAGKVSASDSEGHSANLVSQLSAGEAGELAQKIIEYVDIDIQSRADWQQRLDQGMELMGLKSVPGENLPFNGASSVTYPLIGEAVVQFQARAIEEVFPSDGPVKSVVIGKKTKQKEAQAERVADHMNYQMLHQDRSYFWHIDQLLFYLPLGGSAFKKTYFDPVAKMLVGRFVKSQDFIVPYLAVDLASAPRYTHRMVKTDGEMKKLFASGFYEEADLLKTPYGADGSDPARAAEDLADSRSDHTHYDDSQNTLLECHIDLELESLNEGVDYPLPYIATVLKENQKLIGLRRNWKEEDPHKRKRIWFTHYRYLPGFGFYGLGLLHLIGSLAEATSASIRALLDSAMFANMQGGFASNDVKFKPGEERVTPGVYHQVNMSAEELSRAFYTPPFKDPSPALAQLTEKLVEAGKSFTLSTEVLTGEANNTAPVGTTVALIEQGLKPLSGIHRRLHLAAAEEFDLRAELNFEHMEDHYPYEIEGEDQFVLKSDYDGRVDILPVSDPNIFSTSQRIAQAQAVTQLASENPDLYDRKEAHLRMLKAMKVPEPELLIPTGPQVKRQDPVTENSFILIGKPVRSYLDQDHKAHLDVHLKFLAGLNEEALKRMGMPLQSHIAEHYAMDYWMDMNRAAGGNLPPLDLYGEMPPEQQEEIPPEAETQIAQWAATQPPIQLMPPTPGGPEMEQEAHENEQRRLEEAHQAQLIRDQETHEVDLQRKMEETQAKVAQGDAQAAAKIDQSDKLTEAKVEEQRKLGNEKIRVAREQSKAKVKEVQEASKVKIEETKAISKEKVKAAKAVAKAKPKPKKK